jgi:hypothetical protein
MRSGGDLNTKITQSLQAVERPALLACSRAHNIGGRCRSLFNVGVFTYADPASGVTGCIPRQAVSGPLGNGGETEEPTLKLFY